jgi:hypothetical protein
MSNNRIIGADQGPNIKFRRRREDVAQGTNLTMQTPNGADVTVIGGRSLHLDVAVQLACAGLEAGLPIGDVGEPQLQAARRLIELDDERSRSTPAD